MAFLEIDLRQGMPACAHSSREPISDVIGNSLTHMSYKPPDNRHPVAVQLLFFRTSDAFATVTYNVIIY